MAFLQSKGMRHGNLKLSTIYIVMTFQGQKIYKVADEQLMSYPSLYMDILQSPQINRQGIYLSPLLFNQLVTREKNPIHNTYRSDVFSLAMNIMQLALWCPMDDAYDWTNFKVNEVVIMERLNRIREKYSNELLCIL
jgi:hypothetical protein